MTRDEFDRFCESLHATTHIIQWGGASVWKVGEKIFAIASPVAKDCDHQPISFKCSEISYDILCEQDGLAPAPYLARAKWIQIQKQGALSEDELKDYIQTAHDIIRCKLTKKVQRDLGFDDV